MFFSDLGKELRQQLEAAREAATTLEFWIYVAVVLVLVLIMLACAYLAINFDTLTRNKLAMALSCRTGERQMGTIIVGSFILALACLFTLGEVTHWVEERRASRAPGRRFTLGYWRPLLHVVGTIVLGLVGISIMAAWCS